MSIAIGEGKPLGENANAMMLPMAARVGGQAPGILHPKHQLLLLALSAHSHLERHAARLHTVLDGIFNQGLKQEMRNGEPMALGLTLDLKLKMVFVAHALDANVLFGQSELVGDRDRGFCAAI